MPPNAERAAIEHDIAAIWQDIRCQPASARDADFFDDGGDSLELLDMLAAIERRQGVRLPPKALAGRLTIATLAQFVADKARQSDTDVLVTLQPDGDRPPFFCVHGRSGNVLHLGLLARHMGRRRPFVAPHCPPGQMPAASIEAIARGYADAVMARQPQGAIAVGGYSLGAVIAFEMARQIAAAGREIAVVAIIDFPPPGHKPSARTVLPALTQWVSGLPAYLNDRSFREDVVAWRREARRRVGNGIRTVLGRPAAPPAPPHAHFTPEQVQLAAAHEAALRRYRLRRCDVPMAVFRCSAAPIGRFAVDTTLGWRGLTDAVVAVERVPGNHYSLTMEPHVRALAHAVSRVLDKVQA